MSMTILVIEDEPDLRGMIVEYLAKKGYRVTGAGTLADAAESLDMNPPDAVLSDIRLPDGDGVSFCLDNQPRFPKARWILMSGDHDLVRLGQRARDTAAMASFIIVDKPMPLRLLDRILNQPPAA